MHPPSLPVTVVFPAHGGHSPGALLRSGRDAADLGSGGTAICAVVGGGDDPFALGPTGRHSGEAMDSGPHKPVFEEGAAWGQGECVAGLPSGFLPMLVEPRESVCGVEASYGDAEGCRSLVKHENQRVAGTRLRRQRSHGRAANSVVGVRCALDGTRTVSGRRTGMSEPPAVCGRPPHHWWGVRGAGGCAGFTSPAVHAALDRQAEGDQTRGSGSSVICQMETSSERGVIM